MQPINILSACLICLVSATHVVAQTNNSQFDGRWIATVGSQGGCNFTSTLTVDVSGSSIVGNARNPFGTFPLTGKVDPNGNGDFKIGSFVGTIKFAANTFEANYANTCGGRFASGTKQSSLIKDASLSAPSGPGTISVPLQRHSGIYVVPALINDTITLYFAVDSGAAQVSLPADVVFVLFRTGTLKATDFIGQETFVLADGSTMPSRVFRLRSLKVGDKIVENVIASMAPVKGGLLLGQSFLSRFKSWSLDNTRQALVLE